MEKSLNELDQGNEMNLRCKLIMTFGFLKGLASLNPEESTKIEDFCIMMRFDDLLKEANAKEKIQK